MPAIFYLFPFIYFLFSIGKPTEIIKNTCSIILIIFLVLLILIFLFFIFLYIFFFVESIYLSTSIWKVSDAIKWEIMSLSNINTSCRIKAAGQWNMVCQQNLLFGTCKFRDNVENEKFILFLNRNTGLNAV